MITYDGAEYSYNVLMERAADFKNLSMDRQGELSNVVARLVFQAMCGGAELSEETVVECWTELRKRLREKKA